MSSHAAPLRARMVTDPYYRRYFYDARKIAESCQRAGICKFVGTPLVRSYRFARVCPSSAFYHFDAYSQQGRLNLALALMEGRLRYEDSEALLDVVYTCNMCGACDAMCKLFCNEGEPLRVMQDLRMKLVEDGQLLPQHIAAIEGLRKDDNMMLEPRAERGRWAEGLKVKTLPAETAEVCFHAGCRFSYDPALWKVARQAVQCLVNAGLDVGIMGKEETCCGCRAYEMGYQGEFRKYAESNVEAWRRAGVRTVVTSCADCYFSARRLYGGDHGFEVLHTVEVIEHLLRDGRITFRRELPLTVTYHDPCHLGRRQDVYVPGKAIEGVYDAPRDVLRRIPGVRLLEMDRIREYAWCCGAGGHVRDDYPEFNAWTAAERIEEAGATGAGALVTTCPGCQRNLTDAVEAAGGGVQVFDIIEVVARAL